MGTVISVDETWDESAGWTHSGEPGSGTSTATRKFNATCTADTRPQEILLDTRVPQTGAPHPWNSVFQCRGSKANRTSPITYEITSDYDINTSIADGDPTYNPLNEPAVIRVRTVKSEEEIDEDVDGNPIATENNEPIYGVTRKFSDMAISITKNLAAFYPTNVDLYADTVNSTTFQGFAAGRLRLEEVEAESVTADGFTYWKASVILVARRVINQSTTDRAWWKRVRHEGFKEKTEAPDNAIVNAVDENLDPVSKPVLLDSDGRRVTDPANAHWLEFQVYETADFNNLIVI